MCMDLKGCQLRCGRIIKDLERSEERRAGRVFMYVRQSFFRTRLLHVIFGSVQKKYHTGHYL